MGTVGNLGSVEYDIVANDRASAGLESARSSFVVTAGDIVKAIQAITDKLAEFDEKNSKLNGDLGITALTLNMNAEELRGWAAELSSAADPIEEMSGVLDVLARAGLRTHDELVNTASSFDLLSHAVNVDADILTAQMVPAFKAMGISIQDVGQYSDVLAFTMNATGVRVEDFTMAVKRAGPELASAGVGMNDLAAIMVILKDRGYEGRNMMSELTTATGMSSDANKDGKVSLDEMLAAMKISNTELVTTKARVEDSSKGYAAQAAQIRESNIPIQTQYNNAIDNTVLGLGGLTSPLTSAASLFGSFASTISGLAIPAMILFPAQVAALGTSITAGLGSLGGVLSAAGTALAGSLVAAVGAGILLGLGGVWVLMKTGILDAISSLGNWIKSSPIGSTIMDALKIVLWPIGSLGAGIIELVKGNLSGIGPAMLQPLGQAADAVRNFVNSITGMFSNFGSGFSGVVGIVQGLFSGIAGAFYGMAGQIQGVFSQMMNALMGLINSTAGGFRAAGMNIITSMVNGIVAAAGGIVTAIGNTLQQVRALFPFSPAKEGPLAQVPNWSAYMTEPIAKEVGPATKAAASVAGGIAGVAPAAAASGSAGKASSGGGDTITIAPGAIVINGAGQNADEIANMVIQKFSQARAQKGYRTA